MSKFFKALEHAERNNTEQVPRAPVEVVSQRPSVLTRWPEQTKERPPVFTAPPPGAPSLVAEPGQPPAESPRPVFEPPRPSSSRHDSIPSCSTGIW